MNAEEINKLRSTSEHEIEYIPIENTPLTIGRRGKEYHLLLGKWKLNDEPFETINQVEVYMKTNMWNLVMKIASSVTFDMVKPYVQIQATKEAGVKINEPEIISDGKGPLHGSYNIK